MKHCDKCGTFYSDSLSCCPKCNPQLELMNDNTINEAPKDRSVVKKQWIAILIGIPAMILVYYIVIHLLHWLSS